MKKVIGILALCFTVLVANAQESDVFSAARSGDIEFLETYQAKGLPLDTANSKGFTPLILAVYNQQVKAADFLLNKGADVNAKDLSGNTALMGAIFKGYNDVVSLLLKNNVNVNQQNKNGATALIFAATFGRVTIAEELLRHKVDKSIKDNGGKIALDHAKIQENLEFINLLQ